MNPSDPLYASQWHFDLIGDIEEIWDDYSGDGVHVLVMDDGVDYDHQDLDDNYDSSLEFYYGGSTYDPFPISNSDGHGTSVAGLIAAENNGIGAIGVAWGASITGFNYLSDLQNHSFSLVIQAFEDWEDFDVVNNSWGLSGSVIDFDTNYDPLTPGYSTSLYYDALSNSIENGRDGRGTIQLFAAGNETMNASGSYVTNYAEGIAVAATDRFGFSESYSNFGASVFISAPAASETTDMSGFGGYDISDYTSTFGGTSAATPVTSGVVALMLEANPELGWRDVKMILALSASQTGSVFGDGNTGYEVGEWFSNGASNWNGGGLTFHQSYGFGMVDAFAAVKLAEVWGILTGGDYDASADQSVYTVQSSSSNLSVSDGGSRQISLTNNTDTTLDGVYVTMRVSSAEYETLTLILIDPDGNQYELYDQQLNYAQTLGSSSWEYSFYVAGTAGMSSSGTWSLEVVDNANDGSSVTINEFSMQFMGETASSDDIYHFTDDFAELQNEEGFRSSISDTNGGTDWLNFAMMNERVTVRLDGSGTINFLGEDQATVLDPMEIENVMGGNKRDVIYGNEGDNWILGLDGDDTIRGERGNDRIEGGDGDDALYGRHGFDYIFGQDGDDTISGGKSRDRLEGGAGHDVLDGSQGKDNIFGGQGDDQLLGGSSNDRLSGGAGRDQIDAGSGDDRVYGGSGSDEFIFMSGNEVDTIYDFDVSEDQLSIDSSLVSNVGTLGALASVADGDITFDFGGGDQLIILDETNVNAVLDTVEFV